MPTTRRGLRRTAWYSCLAAAVGFAVVGVITAPSAGATGTAKYAYSSTVGAIGVQTALFSKPEPSSVPDLFDVQTTSSDAKLDSYGTSLANGHIGNLNGLGQLPTLICLASPQFCNSIPVDTLTAGNIKTFPPPDPLNAASVYPAQQHATAPMVGKKKATVKTHSGPFTLADGTASSSATETATSTDARDGNVSLLGGIKIGSVHTTTKQVAGKAAMTTLATSQVNDINIGTGHLMHIGSVTSTLRIVSAPKKPATDKVSSVISGVTVMGKDATIDRKGVHVKSGPKSDAYQKVLDTIFGRAGLNFKQGPITRKNSHAGHSVSVGGLLMFYKHNVKGVPPLNVGFPPGVPCPIKTPSQLPLDPCAGVGLNLNAKYRGQVAFGQVAGLSLAQPPTKTPTVPPVKTPTNPIGNTGPGVGPGSTSGGITGGTGGTPGSAAIPGSGSTTSAGSGSDAAPQLAGHSQPFLDPLAGLGGRLWWFFPLIALGVFAMVGRLRLPARLPSQR